MPSRPKQPPRLKAEKIENPDRAKDTDFSAYQIYAGTEGIARLAGSPNSVMLLWSGELDRDMWLPENLPSLTRVVLPQQTENLSDEQVMEGSEVRVIVSGKMVGHGLASREPGPNGRVPMDWNLHGKEDFEHYGRLLRGQDAKFSAFRIDVCIEDVRGIISYVPGLTDQAVRDGEVGSKSGGISLHHDPSLPWCWQTVEFFKRHHSSSTVSGINRAHLEARITGTSRVIAGLAPASRALAG
jgi:hypothetical protein